jgi:hypothetical protein
MFTVPSYRLPMRALLDRITDAMRDRTAPLCVSCLTSGLVTGPPAEPPDVDFDRVMRATQDVALRRSYGACPECSYRGVLLHPPS